MMKRMIALFALMAAFAATQAAAQALPEIRVHKSASCGCCNAWVDHLRASGFTVQATDVADVDAVKRRLGVRPELAACHTAEVGGYVVEGHVPAGDIKRLLRERPKALGLAVPGMPVGSPGMETGPPQPYASLLFNRAGDVGVFERH